MYVAQVQQIQVLSTQGSSQLAADLEYFCNVLSALGVALPPALATWQVISHTKERLQEESDLGGLG